MHYERCKILIIYYIFVYSFNFYLYKQKKIEKFSYENLVHLILILMGIYFDNYNLEILLISLSALLIFIRVMSSWLEAFTTSEKEKYLKVRISTFTIYKSY